MPDAVRVTDLYSRSAHAYERHWGSQLAARGRLLVDGLPIANARRVLDLGAGVGINLGGLRVAAPNALVVAADGSEDMLRLATGPRVVLDVHALAFADEAFDAVLVAFVLHHLADPGAALAKIGRVLMPGGWLAIGTWTSDPESLPAERIWAEELERAGAPVGPDVSPGQAATSSPADMSALLTAAGFDVERTATHTLDDRMDPEEFVLRRTTLGLQGWRFASLREDARSQLLGRVRVRLASLSPDGLNARETAILTWARRRS